MRGNGPLESLSHEIVETAVTATITPRVESVRPIEAGVNDLFRIDRADGPPMVFKSPRYASEAAFLAEPRLLVRLNEETSMPVPDVITCCGAEESPHGRSFYVMEFIEGRRDLDMLNLESQHRHTLVGLAGEHLAAIESLEIEGPYGTLAVDEGTVTATDPIGTWNQQFERMIKTLRQELLGRGPLADSEPRFDDMAEPIAQALASPPIDEPQSPRIVMTDYRLGNLVLGDADGDTLVRGILDVGGIIGDGRLAVAMAEDALIDVPFGGREEADKLRSTLRERYANARGQDRTRLFDGQYERYRLFARADRMAAFGYTAQFAREECEDVIADRWRHFVQDRIADSRAQ